MKESRKRGKVGGVALNTKTIKLYNVSTVVNMTKLIEVLEYFRDITYAGGWDFEDMQQLGHTLISVFIGDLGTTPSRKDSGKYCTILDQTLPIKAAKACLVSVPKVMIGSSKRFNSFKKDLFENLGVVLNKHDVVVINELVTMRNGTRYVWKRVSMLGTTGTRVSKLALHSVNGVRVGNLSDSKKRALLSELGGLVKQDLCTIVQKETESKLACGG